MSEVFYVEKFRPWSF